jgi:hypothetical protein
VNRKDKARRALAVLICLFMAVGSAVAAQQDSGLKVLVVRGSNSANVVSQPARPIAVRVTDRSDRPISGATVVFTAPASGAGGDFANGTNPVIVFTDAQGLATAPQYRANSSAGAYQILVRAAYMSQVASASIEQTNVLAQKSHKAIIFAALAGGAAAVAFAAKGGGGGSEPSSPSTPPTTTPTLPTIVLTGSSVSGPR